MRGSRRGATTACLVLGATLLVGSHLILLPAAPPPIRTVGTGPATLAAASAANRSRPASDPFPRTRASRTPVWPLAPGRAPGVGDTIGGTTGVPSPAADDGAAVLVRRIGGRPGTVGAIAWSPDGSLLASIASSDFARVTQIEVGRTWALAVSHPSSGQPVQPLRVAFAPDGAELAVGYADGGVRLVRAATGDVSRRLDHESTPGGLAFSSSGRVLAVGMTNGRVQLWDRESGRPTRTLLGHLSPVRSVVFSPDGGAIATADGEGTIKLWDIASGRSTHALAHGGFVAALAFSADGATLAAAGLGGVSLWDAALGVETGRLGQAASAQQVVFAPDGRELTTLDWLGTVRSWDIAAEQVTRSRRTADATALAALAADGQVAVARMDGPSADIDLWDAGRAERPMSARRVPRTSPGAGVATMRANRSGCRWPGIARRL
jgi:WD40 repeat protein